MNGEYTRLSDGLRAIGQRLEPIGRRLERLEEQTDPGVVLLKLEQLSKDIAQVWAGVDKINGRVRQAETLLSQHETRISLMERFNVEQVKPALAIVTDNKIQMAVFAAKYGAIGFGATGGTGLVVYLIGKSIGAW